MMFEQMKFGIVAFFICSILICFYLIISSNIHDYEPPHDNRINPLDDCQFLFLDLGTNFGVQIRKLYEPHLYPGAKVIQVFQKYFGEFRTRNVSQVCAVGWEPNPKHEEYLNKMNQAYKSCGFRAHIHTKTGVGATDRVSQFVENIRDTTYRVHHIKILRIAHYINAVVGTRRLPTAAPGAVVMKMDVEGLELEIMTDLIHSGALRHLDNVHTEYHTSLHKDYDTLRRAIEGINQVVRNLNIKLIRHTELSTFDDESYGAARELKPMPIC